MAVMGFKIRPFRLHFGIIAFNSVDYCFEKSLNTIAMTVGKGKERENGIHFILARHRQTDRMENKFNITLATLLI